MHRKVMNFLGLTQFNTGLTIALEISGDFLRISLRGVFFYRSIVSFRLGRFGAYLSRRNEAMLSLQL